MKERIEPRGPRGWAVLRLVLGFAQISGSVTAFVLLLQTGFNRISLAVVVLTGLCTTVSVLLFGGRARAR